MFCFSCTDMAFIPASNAMVYEPTSSKSTTLTTRQWTHPVFLNMSCIEWYTQYIPHYWRGVIHASRHLPIPTNDIMLFQPYGGNQIYNYVLSNTSIYCIIVSRQKKIYTSVHENIFANFLLSSKYRLFLNLSLPTKTESGIMYMCNVWCKQM